MSLSASVSTACLCPLNSDKGEKITNLGWFKDSVQGDLQSFFEKLKIGKIQKEYIFSFILPKLTPEEMKLVANKDPSHFQSYTVFGDGRDPDVTDQEMNLSESKSKFVYEFCFRDSHLLNVEKFIQYMEASTCMNSDC